MMLVREVTADDWAALRDMRLAALSEAPYAFGSTYAREAAFTEDRWRGRISERSVTFFAHAEPGEPDRAAEPAGPGERGEPGRPAGSADASAGPAGIAGVLAGYGDADLVSLWVRPSARGLGVGDALVEAAASWARQRGYPVLYLWVTESNAPARRLYQRLGFTATGERKPLPSDPALPEIRMSRPL